MGAFIGRRREQADLEEYCRSGKAELVCVYGRRRAGKTYLVDNTFSNKLAFAVTGAEDKRTPTQLKVFSGALKRFGDRGHSAPRDWFEAFDRLRALLESDSVTRGYGRRIVFLDEFPWLAGKRSDFLVAFADFWNSWASKHDDLMVIICGSATSWIVRNIFENSGSMYNRVTRRVFVAPFNLRETEMSIESMGLGWSRDTVLKAYLVFGGLPYYLDMLDRRLSLAQNIDELCFDVRAPLRDEVPRLMEATLADSPLHREILGLLSRTKAGMHRTSIAESVGDNGNNLKRSLDDLEKCGYIRRYHNPYEKYHPAIFQLVDPFLLFAFRFMGDHPLKSWVEFEGSPAYYAWRGNAFEMACLNHIPQIKRALGIAAVETECFPWASCSSSPGAQIDLVIERKDSVTDLCEMKYTDGPYSMTEGDAEALERKRSVFRQESGTDNAVHLALVSANGFRANAHSGGIAVAVTADDLFF